MKKPVLFILFLFGFISGYSQTDSYGTEFWTGFLETGQSINSYRLYIHASATTDVTITIPLKSWSKKIKVLTDQTRIVYLPVSDLMSPGDEITGKTGIHIASDEPITVNTVALETHSTVTTQVIPLFSINDGSSYISCNAEPNSYNKIFMVSADDSAKIEITPTDITSKGKQVSVPFTINLNEGETYQFLAQKNCFDGTTLKVLNDKRVIAYSGDLNVNNNIYGGCGHRQMATNLHDVMWADSKYITMPFFGQRNGYFVKLLSLEGTTQIKINGKNYTIVKPDSAIQIDVPKEDSVLVITGDKKFACFEIMKGGGKNGFYKTQAGHPSMVQVISPANLTKNSSFLSLDSTNNVYHYISILVPKGGIYNTYLDGSAISSTEFIEIPDDKDFMYAKLDVSKGHHTITGPSGHLVYAYGIQHSTLAESYYYLAGFTFPNFNISSLDSVVEYDCKAGKITVQLKAKIRGLLKKYYWDFGDGTKDTSRIVNHTFDQGKDYIIKFVGTGMDDKIDSVVKKYNFKWPSFNPVFDKAVCGSTLVYEEKNPFFTNFKWQDSSVSKSYNATKTEKLWVRATDKSGECKFSDSAKFTLFESYTKIFVDSIFKCQKNNLFNFRDSSFFKGDSIRLKVWSFPGGFNVYDTNNFKYHFPQSGKLKVYLDLYPVSAPCKSRIEIPVTVNSNTMVFGYTDKEKYCNGEMAFLKGKPFNCCQKIKKFFWEFDDGTKLKSDSGNFHTRVYFDYKNEDATREFLYITETEQGCRDTFEYGLLVFPAAKSNFDMGQDSIKCLALSRWTFTHTVKENITGPYNLLWDFGNGKTGTLTQYKNFRYLDTGTYKIKLITTTSIGCLDSTVKQVKVIKNAVAKFSVADSIQCFANNSFEVIDSSKGYDLKYLWNFGNGIISNSSKPNPMQYDTAGKYKIKLSVVSNYPGCFADSVVHNVNVLKPPKADFVFNSDTQCFINHAVTLTDSSKFYYGKYKLYWSYLNKVDSFFTPTNLHFSDTGNYFILLIAKDSMGCKDSISKTASLKPQPELAFTINDTIQCFGINDFLIIANPDSKIKNRIWRLNNHIIAGDTLQKNITEIATSGLHKIVMQASTHFGCTDSLTKWVEVLQPFKADFVTNKDTQCFTNHSLTISSKIKPPKDLIKKLTYKEGDFLIGITDNISNYKFPLSGSKAIRLFIETENGCKDSAEKSIFLAEDPVAIFQSDSVCIGEVIKFKANQVSGFPIINWSWNMDDGNKFEINTFTHNYKNSGAFSPKIRFTDRFGCFGTFTGNPVIIYPLPQTEFNINRLATDEHFTLVKLKPKTLGYLSYLWSFPDGTQNTEDTPGVKLSKFFKDRIHLKVISQYGCIDTASQFLYMFPPLNTLYIENAFTPNSDQLNESFKPGNIDGAKEYKLNIYNRWGEHLFYSSEPNKGWNGEYKGEPVQEGVYIFTVEFMYADGNRYSAKGNVMVVR